MNYIFYKCVILKITGGSAPPPPPLPFPLYADGCALAYNTCKYFMVLVI